MYSRRILLHTPFSGQPSGPSQPVSGATIVEGGSPGSNFDANIVMILAVLLCALICALGLNSIVRCALRCSSRMVVDPEPSRVTRLAQSGLRRKALRSMPILLYSTGLKLNTVSPMCAICLSDFEDGEHVRVLPKCNHGFHVRCIDRWLLARSTCPTCRQSLFGAPQKASGCSESEGSQAEPAPARPVLAPLRPEGLGKNRSEDFRSNHMAVLHHQSTIMLVGNQALVAKVQVSGTSIFSCNYREIRALLSECIVVIYVPELTGGSTADYALCTLAILCCLLQKLERPHQEDTLRVFEKDVSTAVAPYKKGGPMVDRVHLNAFFFWNDIIRIRLLLRTVCSV
uniref:RING-type domain-containing protein n=1 Tax=Oryza nivara TaxID=4536 RepID=A0A0E0H0N3_ORYNI